MPLNMHGFWTREYGTTLVGHGGTQLAIHYILLDLKNGIGMTVMTNQDHESVITMKCQPWFLDLRKRRTQPPLTNSSLVITELLATLPVVLCLSPELCFTLSLSRNPRTIRF